MQVCSTKSHKFYMLVALVYNEKGQQNVSALNFPHDYTHEETAMI